MSQQKPSSKLVATAGLSIAAGMLMTACGGSDAPPPAAGPAAGPTATPIVQPVWASMGVLVAPGQASKTIALTGCSGEGTDIQTVSNASVTISANGNVSFKAVTTEGAAARELVAITLAETTTREAYLYAGEGRLTDAYYEYESYPESGSTSKEINFSSGEGFYAYTSNGDTSIYIYCDDVPVADLTPAAAFLPSEQRVASAFLAGTTAADFRQYGREYVARLIDGVFSWANYPLNVPGANEAELRTASTINIASGQLFKGVLSESGNGLGTSPAPVRVTYSGALQSGNYSETFNAATREAPSYRRVELYISNGENTPDRFELSRVDNVLLAGRFYGYNDF